MTQMCNFEYPLKLFETLLNIADMLLMHMW